MMKILKFILFLIMIGGTAQAEELQQVGFPVVITYSNENPVEWALIKVYDSEHQYLGQCYSDSSATCVTFIEDQVKLKGYGTYYIEVSKAGFRTIKEKVVIEDVEQQDMPVLVLSPKGEYDIYWIIGGITFIIIILFAVKKRKKGRK